MKRRNFFATVIASVAAYFSGIQPDTHHRAKFCHYSPGSKVGPWIGWIELDKKVVGFLQSDGSYHPFTPPA